MQAKSRSTYAVCFRGVMHHCSIHLAALPKPLCLRTFTKDLRLLLSSMEIRGTCARLEWKTPSHFQHGPFVPHSVPSHIPFGRTPATRFACLQVDVKVSGGDEAFLILARESAWRCAAEIKTISSMAAQDVQGLASVRNVLLGIISLPMGTAVCFLSKGFGISCMQDL